MTRTETLTSARNPLLKEVRKAVARGSLTSEGYMIAETFHLLDEARRSHSEIGAVLFAESAGQALEGLLPELPGTRRFALPDALFAEVASTEASQGVMALVKPVEWDLKQMLRWKSPRHAPLVAVLDGVQDPGNAGAIVRAAEAFEATGVLFLKGSVNPYNPKTVRASAGSLFRMPMVQGMDAAETLAVLGAHNLEVYAAMPTPHEELKGTDLTQGCAIVIGSEGRGVSPEFARDAKWISIPTRGVESLNAAMAAGILLYEARRQRNAEI